MNEKREIKVDFSDLKKQFNSMFNFDELIEASKTHRIKQIIINKIVDSCGECDYIRGGHGNFCSHPDLNKNEKNSNGKILAYYHAIPKWCPLDDAEPQKDDE